MPGRLVRFRADPRRIRVSIRHVGERFGMEGDWYEARVHVVKGSHCVAACRETSPELAIIGALEIADEHGFDGIDLGMQWTYGHPWLDPDPMDAPLVKCGIA